MEYACNFIKKETVFIKKETDAACSFIKKESLAQVFSCEFCKISKNTFIYRTPLVAASGVLNSQGNSQESRHRSSQAEVFLVKGVLKICSRFTGEHSCWSVISITLQSTHWNHTLVWLFFSKFAAYFQNTFLWEHLWSAASAVNYFCKKNYIIDVWQSPEYTFVIYTSDK